MKSVLSFAETLWFGAFAALAAAAALAGFVSPAVAGERTVLCLDGAWQIAEGSLSQPPTEYPHTAPVPGLADLASPPFESPGSTVSLDDRGKPWLRPADPFREAFWYRRKFKLDQPVPAVAMLKVYKARYGTQVFVNGQLAGEHGPCFTPGWFDVRAHLKPAGQENELLIRVGASLAQVPPQLTDGWDNEKSRYIPGIYDSVELILCGTPHVVNVQTVPDVQRQSVTAVIELAQASGAANPLRVKGLVREAKSRRTVGEASQDAASPARGAVTKVELTIPIRDAHCWTPEDPFLYELEVDTGGDVSHTRFGLRTFTTDPETGRALLNGRPYYLRGSNVCIYRFFEDAERKELPWDRQWVRNLHRRFKEMHWNSLRYCIGFPPELWYEIADEEGVLIQDEFPIWYSRAKDGWPAAITPADLAIEYTGWMRERWNHPCVVIWDAQNETSHDRVIAQTIGLVRDQDLSRRPWDNGWGTPQRPGDISEGHPYRASRPGFRLADFAKEDGIPNNGPRQGAGPPYLINEYGWLWINRDGSLPTLTVDVYQRLLGENASIDQRRLYYARTLAAMTEFWRVRRRCAGVLHFCGLGYSRADGQTSDNFVEVGNLVYEPHFFEYVRDAFAPVGVVIDFWEQQVAKGAAVRVPVRVVNDLETAWQGEVVLRLLREGQVVWEQKQIVQADAYQVAVAEFDVAFPAQDAALQLVAELRGADHRPVRSWRDVRCQEIPVNLALGRPVTASSQVRNAQGFFPAAWAVDGRSDTRWSSEFADHQWLEVDLGPARLLARVTLAWERAHGLAYAIEVSTDGSQWKEVWRTETGKGGEEEIRFAPVPARYLRFRGDRRATEHGFSLWELQVFGPPASPESAAGRDRKPE
jgi:hypothetical protein